MVNRENAAQQGANDTWAPTGMSCPAILFATQWPGCGRHASVLCWTMSIFIHSFNKHMLNTYSVPGPVVADGASEVSELPWGMPPCLWTPTTHHGPWQCYFRAVHSGSFSSHTVLERGALSFAVQLSPTPEDMVPVTVLKMFPTFPVLRDPLPLWPHCLSGQGHSAHLFLASRTKVEESMT